MTDNEESYQYAIENIIPASVPMAAVCVAGADIETSVPEDAKVARLERILAIAMIEEIDGSKDPVTTVMPMSPADDGTLMASPALDGYIGFVEIPHDLMLPLEVDLDREEGQSPVTDLVCRHIERHNAKTMPREPARLVSIGDKKSSAGKTEPAPAPIPEPSPFDRSEGPKETIPR
jgi:hypothetical protein